MSKFLNEVRTFFQEKFLNSELLSELKEKIEIQTSNSPLCGREKFGKKDECLIYSG